MKVIVRITICIWTILWSVAIVSAITKPSMILQKTFESNPKLKYNTITLDLDDASTDNYLEVIIALRAALASNQVACNLPVLRHTASTEDRFVLVDLKIISNITVTIAIDVLDVYVVGYLDKLGGNNRANFLKEIPDVAVNNLFPGAIVRHIPFTGHYTELQRQGEGVDRTTIPLGLFSLKAAVKGVYGIVKPKPKDEAKFLIIAIEMLSEAARFKYIAKEIRRIQPFESVLQNPKVLKLENSWGPLSEGIIGSNNCDNLKRPITLVDAYNNIYIVTKVNEVAADMGILNHNFATVQVY